MRKGSFSLASISWYVLLLSAVCWFAVPASASEATNNAATMHLLRPGTAAVADLDGDYIPDVTSGIRTGHTSAGYSYRVDFDLSSNPEAKSFNVFSDEPNGLNIEAIDVDGDTDLDLVITGRLSPKPIAIWINDGRGSFTPGDLNNYGLPSWQTRQSVKFPETPSSVVLHFEWRPQLAGPAQRMDLRAVDFWFAEVHFSSAKLPQIALGSARLRGPPIPAI